MEDFIFAVRRYYCVGIEHQLVDRLVRKASGEFTLVEGPEQLGGPEVEKPFSLVHVYEWLQELPWEIERTVIVNPNLCRTT